MRRFPDFEKTYNPETRARVKRALVQIGEIKPWFDADLDCWIFEHPDFPESYAGESAAEVIKGYPYYLANMFASQIEGTLAPYVAERIHMRGGRRPGAGRPKGSVKRPGKSVWLPAAVADWIKASPENLEAVETLMEKRQQA